MERSARLGSLLPYRKAAEVMAEFLPTTESFVTLRHRTMKLGQRLDEKLVNAPGSSRRQPLSAARSS